MSNERKHDLDIFVLFLLHAGGYATVSDASAILGFDARTLNRANARKIRSLPAMNRWVQIFMIPTPIFGEWLKENITALVTDTELIDLAS